MASPKIIVSTTSIQFPRGKLSTEAIDVRVTVSDLHVKVRHNLPSCFTLDFPIGQSEVLVKVFITFNPSIEFEMPQNPLQIEFIDYFDYLSTGNVNNSVKVFIKIVEPQTKPNKINHLFSEQLECKICLREFSEDDENLTPRILTSCGHTLCFKCCSTIPGIWGIPCPFDTMITPLTPQELPKNRIVIDMLRELKTSAPAISENTSNSICYENGLHEAKCFCTTCQAAFCESCFTAVHSSKILSGHESVPVAVSQVTVGPPKCQIHPDKHVKYVCREVTCQIKSKLICKECTEHRGHNLGYYVSAANQARERLHKTVALLQETEANMQKKMNNAQKCKRSFEGYGMKHREKVSDIIEHFETQKDLAIQKFTNFADFEAHKMDLEIVSLRFDAKRVDRMRQELENVLSKKADLLEVEDLISKGERMCQLETERKDTCYSLSDYDVPNDMSTTPRIRQKISMDQSVEAIERMMLGLRND